MPQMLIYKHSIRASWQEWLLKKSTGDYRAASTSEWSTMLWWQVLVFLETLSEEQRVWPAVSQTWKLFNSRPQNPAPGWYWVKFINIWRLFSGVWKMTCSFMVGVPVWPFRAASFLGNRSTVPGMGWRTFRKGVVFELAYVQEANTGRGSLEPSKGAQCRSLSQCLGKYIEKI